MALDLNYDPYKSVSYYEQQVAEAQKEAGRSRVTGLVALLIGIAITIVNIAISGYLIWIWLWIIGIILLIGGIVFIISGPKMYKDELDKSQQNLQRRRAEPVQ